MKEAAKVIYTSDYLDVYEVVDQPRVFRCNWKGTWLEVTPDLKVALEKSLALIEEHRYEALISDCSLLDTMAVEVTDYLQETWYKEAFRLGLHLELLISPDDAIGEIALSMLTEEVNAGKTMALQKVESLEAAEALAQKLIPA